MRSWTSEQLEAINYKGDLIVSAAAGSGKTAVLTERIARLVSEGASVCSMLVVTFTNAAAAEMKKRIEARLYELSDEAAESKLKSHLYAEAQNVSRANISTLHKFCAFALRRHYNEVEIDPAFRIAEDTDSAILRSDSIDEMLETLLESDKLAVLQLMKAFGGEKPLIDAVLAVYNLMRSRPDPFDFLESAVREYAMDASELKNSSAVKYLFSAYKANLSDALDNYTYARSLTQDTKAHAAIDADVSVLRAILNENSYDKFVSLLQGLEFSRLTFSKDTSPDEKEAVKLIRQEAKKDIEAIKKEAKRPLCDESEVNARFYPHMLKLAEAIRLFHSIYDRKKREGAMLDFADLEHLVLRLLENERIAGEYKEKFDYIFVDEYQDTNLVQERIINSITKKGGLFLVGDIKQSIYRFRLAEPKLFLDRLKTNAIKRIDLNANFRSSQSVISTVNEVFSRVMSIDTSDMDYDSRAKMYGQRKAFGKAELIMFSRETEDEADAMSIEYNEAEAELAAKKILDIMQNDEYFDERDGIARKYRFSDFCILMRSVKNKAEDFSRVLMNLGIPVYSERSASFFEAIEVQVFMNLLKIIDNKYQDIPMLSVLRSQLYSFTTDELVALRLFNRSDSVAGSLKLATAGENPLAFRARRVLSDLERYKREAALMPVKDLINLLLDESGYLVYISAMPGGAARASNLYELISKAEAIQNNGVRSLSGFLRYSEFAKISGNESEVAKCPADVVRLMSIHKSKGLEFPVTIVAGLGTKFVTREGSAPNALRDSQLHLGVEFIEGNLRLRTIFYRAIKKKQLKENFAEDIRTLYVALSRARERLVLIGSQLHLQKTAMEMQLMSGNSRSALKLKSHLELILFSLMRSSAGIEVNAALNLPPACTLSHIPVVSTVFMPNIGFTKSTFDLLPKALFYKWRSECEGMSYDEYSEAYKFEYPYIHDTLIPSKTTVTDMLNGRDVTLSGYPAFMEEKSDALARGNAAHKLLENISLVRCDRASLEAELARLLDCGIFSHREAELVDLESIYMFLQSELWLRAVASGTVRREEHFNYRISASKLFDTDSNAHTLLQGVIDCCFIENGEWVIIDYKTDHAPKNISPHDVAMAHKKQLMLYAEALSSLTGLRVKQCYVCLLSVGAVVQVF